MTSIIKQRTPKNIVEGNSDPVEENQTTLNNDGGKKDFWPPSTTDLDPKLNFSENMSTFRLDSSSKKYGR